ncbi:C-methyltransferase NovU [Anaerolineaceae bacterium]|nr:C-methyltransferase NovU [Anaerolineaceae bacterium]
MKTHGPATIVTANNIFANVDELGEMTDNIRSLLTLDGVFIFETFYTADFLQNMVFDFIYHEHISLFSVKPLINFFRLHGMELIDAERIPTKGGSLRYTAQLAGGPRKVTPAIAELVDHENKIGLQELATFKVFGAKIDAAKKELHTLLDDLRRQGKKVDGFGASATTTTFLYHLELGNELGCIYDDYKAKQHLFTPGLHLPVLPPDEIYQRKPDYILIIAWRYYQPIMKKHKAFSDQGGKFIVPFPKLQVL